MSTVCCDFQCFYFTSVILWTLFIRSLTCSRVPFPAEQLISMLTLDTRIIPSFYLQHSASYITYITHMNSLNICSNHYWWVLRANTDKINKSTIRFLWLNSLKFWAVQFTLFCDQLFCAQPFPIRIATFDNPNMFSLPSMCVWEREGKRKWWLESSVLSVTKAVRDSFYKSKSSNRPRDCHRSSFYLSPSLFICTDQILFWTGAVFSHPPIRL